MENYVDGKEYFIKGTARSSAVPGRPVEFVYESGYGTNCGILADEPGLLLTASEAAAELVEDTNAQIALYKDEVKKLRSENESLKDAVEVLKEQKKGLEQTIDKHETTIEERTIECNRWEGMYNKASQKCDELQKTCEENVNVALDLARQRDGLKEEFEATLKNLADTGKTCDIFKKQRDEALKDKDDLQKALEALNKDIDEYRATIQKMAAVIGFLCGGEQDG